MLKPGAGAIALFLAAGCTGGNDSAPIPASVMRPAPSPRPAPTPSPAPPECRYVFPVGPASAASYGREHHDYPATDIFAAQGTDVLSPVDGVVDFVSRVDVWKPSTDDPAVRGGLSFAVIGDDGVRYYGSHLRDLGSAIVPGARLEAGMLVGHVGKTGNAKGTPPHLHFGISRPTTPEDWEVRRGELAPYDYLQSWKQGRARTPAVTGARPPSCRPVS